MRWPAGFDAQDVVTPFPARSPDSAAVSVVEGDQSSRQSIDVCAQYETEPMYDERLGDLLKGSNKGVVPGIPIWYVLPGILLKPFVLTRRYLRSMLTRAVRHLFQDHNRSC